MYHYKPYKKLSLISSNNVISFYIMTLNFITNMPFARDSYTEKTCDVILIMIDKIIKHATYVIITMNLKVDEFVNILWREFVFLRDMMRILILNQDLLFINKF